MSDHAKAEKHFNMVGGNNGLAHTGNPARLWYNNFCYRSEQEIMFAKALERRRKTTGEKFLYSPLSVFSLPGSKRRELDYLIIDRGIYLHVEIDGESHNEETVLARNEKEKYCNLNKMDTIRFTSYCTSDSDWADECVKEVFEHIEFRRKGPAI
jgi:ribonucleotide reductase alpha subunit